MATFYKSQQNVSAYEQAKKDGKLKAGKEGIVKGCMKFKKQNPKADCKCVSKVMKNVSDKAFFYETMLTIKIYKETLAAIRAKDNNKAAALKKQQHQRKGFTTTLETKCGLR